MRHSYTSVNVASVPPAYAEVSAQAAPSDLGGRVAFFPRSALTGPSQLRLRRRPTGQSALPRRVSGLGRPASDGGQIDGAARHRDLTTTHDRLSRHKPNDHGRCRMPSSIKQVSTSDLSEAPKGPAASNRGASMAILHACLQGAAPRERCCPAGWTMPRQRRVPPPSDESASRPSVNDWTDGDAHASWSSADRAQSRGPRSRSDAGRARRRPCAFAALGRLARIQRRRNCTDQGMRTRTARPSRCAGEKR